MRMAFTIVFNGLHHLKHNNYSEYLLKECLDYWVVVEGATYGVEGFKDWDSKIDQSLYKNGHSIDGTLEYLFELKKKFNNIILVYRDDNQLWFNKIQMINTGLNEVRKISNNCFLWEIDADEQWTKEQMDITEKELIDGNGKTANVFCFQMVGKDIYSDDYQEIPSLSYRGHRLLPENKDKQHVGGWASSGMLRLWDWNGENFYTHEPPCLVGGNGRIVFTTPKFIHYSFYYDYDVKFKDNYYNCSYHRGCYDAWKDLQKETIFPQPITRLFPTSNDKISMIYKKSEIK